MIDREGYLPIQPAPGSSDALGPSADPGVLEAQWREAARSLGLDEAAVPLLDDVVRPALAAQRQTLMDAGDFEAALEPAWLLAYDDPWNRDHALDFALCLQHLGELEAACRFYSVALLLDPADAYALYRLGECLDGMGERDDARAVYRAALEQAREDAALSDVGQQALARLDALGA